MELIELNKDDEKGVLDYIKEIILNRHPIVDDRLHILYPNFGGPETPEMEVIFRFYNIEGKDITQITFMDGTRYRKMGIPERIRLNGLIPINTIYEFIYFLLIDHDWIKGVRRFSSGTEFAISFDVNGKDDNMHGISCGEIKLEFDFSRHPDRYQLYNNYFGSIVSTFYNELKDTNMMKEEFSNYCNLVKRKFFDSLSEKELRDFIVSLNSGDLYGVIMSLPDNRFIELFNQYNKTSKKEIKMPKLTDN